MISNASRSRPPHDPSAWGLPLLASAMDAAWIAPYTLLLGSAWAHPGAPLLAPLAVFLLLAGAQTLARALLARGGPLARARWLLATSGALAAGAAVAAQYGGDPWWRTHGSLWNAADAALRSVWPEIPAFLLAGLVWRRGIVVGRTALEYYDLEAMFYLGLGALGVFAAGAALAHAEPAVAATAMRALPSLIAFFAAGLVALPVARLRSIRQRTQASPQAVAIGRGWYALVGGAVVAILGIAALAGALLRLDPAAVLRAVGRLLDPLLWDLLYVVAAPLGIVVAGIIWLVRRLLHAGAAQPLHPFVPPAWPRAAPHGAPTGLPPAAATALRWGIAALVAALILLWLARVVFRYDRVGTSPAGEEVHESVWSWADLRAALGAWLRRRPRPADEAPSALDFGSGTAAAVRRAYAELLGLAAARGHPRAPHQTPSEFAGVLGATWPETARGVGALTAVYGRVRYGLEAPSDADLAAVREALARCREAPRPEHEGAGGAGRDGRGAATARPDDGAPHGARGGGRSDA